MMAALTLVAKPVASRVLRAKELEKDKAHDAYQDTAPQEDRR